MRAHCLSSRFVVVDVWWLWSLGFLQFSLAIENENSQLVSNFEGVKYHLNYCKVEEVASNFLLVLQSKILWPLAKFWWYRFEEIYCRFWRHLELWNFIIRKISFIAHCCYSYQSFSDFNGGQFCISYLDFCLYGLIRVLFLCGYLSIHFGRSWQLFWHILK